MLYPDFDELIQLGHKAARLSVESARQVLSASPGDYASPFRGQGLAFHEVRQYRPGDDIRGIDWRVTARTNKPHMKVFTEERERTVLICVDANAGMRFGTRGTFKSVQAARAAALLGWQAQGGHDRVGSVVFGDVEDGMQYFAPARTRRPLWGMLKLLSDRKTGRHKGPVSVESVLEHVDRTAPTGGLVFVISDFPQATEALEKRLGNLRRRCDVVLVAVTDPADREMPPMETVIFSDDSGGKVAVNTDSLAGREAYARQWRENRQRLEDMAKRRGVGLVDVHTAHDVYADLLLGLRRLGLKRRAA